MKTAYSFDNEQIATAHRLLRYRIEPLTRTESAVAPDEGLAEIGAALGLSRERAGQLQAIAFEKLLTYSEAKLGRPARDLNELVGLFLRGPDPIPKAPKGMHRTLRAPWTG